MKNYAIFARICVGIMLIIAWGLVDSPLLGVAFVLVMTALSAARYRVNKSAGSVKRVMFVGEIVVCVGYAFFWLPALLGLWTAVIGIIEDKWREWEGDLLDKSDLDREALLKLEQERIKAASRMQSAKHAAEITERSRIAQDIHDHVGHEISGALIAVQTALKLYRNDDGKSEKCEMILEQVIIRLESASANLRETVHNLKPASSGESGELNGFEALRALCDNFSFCEINFEMSGDLSAVSEQYWLLLAVNLKEALTNISRHSNAEKAEIKIDCNEDYLRMIIDDNGSNGNSGGSIRFGLGLSGMKERVNALNGVLTASMDGGFKIVCVLPIKGI